MKPIEAMAKAHWADSEDTSWENLLPEDRAHMISVMRAALLALAEADISEAMVRLGWKSTAGPDWFDEETRALLRTIAEDRP